MIQELKQYSGAVGFISILGKSTIAKESLEYQLIVGVTNYVLEQGYGVIHGGYAGGAMSAVSDAACTYLMKQGLPKERNIAIPQLQHDGIWPRVEGAIFAHPAKDIYDRLRLVTSGDIAIICPFGGDGTELEVAALLHENILRLSQAKSYPGEKPTPIVFLQTTTGTDWKKLLMTKMRLLATSTKTFEQCPWILFAHSLEEFKQVLQKLAQGTT